MKSDHTEGGLLSNLELTGNRLLLDQTLVLTREYGLQNGEVEKFPSSPMSILVSFLSAKYWTNLNQGSLKKWMKHSN